MEITAECSCGQRFKFDVEPENGQMPFEVKCPSCGTDQTAQANALISEQLAHQPPPAIEPPAVSPSPSGLRISRPTETAAPPPVAPSAIAPPGRIQPVAPPRPAGGGESGQGFVKGVIGALVGATVGMIAWFLLIKATGYEIGYVAWGVGALTGVGARVTGADGGKKLGMIAGVLAFIAIVGGQFLALRSAVVEEFDKVAEAAYEDQISYANEAIALNSPTTQQIKELIAKHNEENVSDVTDDEVKDFNDKELPRLRDLANGKPSKAEYLSEANVARSSWIEQFSMLKDSIGLFTLLWIFLGVGSAYKLAIRQID